MDLKLPNNIEIELDRNLPMEDRLVYINELLNTFKIKLHKGYVNLETYFYMTWFKNSTKICLDLIGYYLTKDDFDNKHDKDIISRRKFREMTKWNDKYSTFSDLDAQDQLNFGLKDYDEE